MSVEDEHRSTKKDTHPISKIVQGIQRSFPQQMKSRASTHEKKSNNKERHLLERCKIHRIEFLQKTGDIGSFDLK